MNTEGSSYAKRQMRLNRESRVGASDYYLMKHHQAELNRMKKKNLEIAQKKVRDTFFNTLKITEGDARLSELNPMLLDVFKKHPTPTHMINMGLQYLSEEGIDTECAIWICVTRRLRKEIEVLTEPNQYYAVHV